MYAIRSYYALAHQVEVVVEARHLVDLGGGEVHLLRERRQVGGGEVAVGVLNAVQMLDEQVAPARGVAQQGAHFAQRLRFCNPPAGLAAGAARPFCGGVVGHESYNFV